MKKLAESLFSLTLIPLTPLGPENPLSPCNVKLENQKLAKDKNKPNFDIATCVPAISQRYRKSVERNISLLLKFGLFYKNYRELSRTNYWLVKIEHTENDQITTQC